MSKVWSERHLPAELWPGILSRLPVKSLLRFRCVSKSWLSLISDHGFRRLHLKNFKNNRDETHLQFVQQGIRQKRIFRCSSTFDYTTETPLSLGDKLSEEGKWWVLCSVDGLILLSWGRTRMEGNSGFMELTVWNPSIRKFHDVPSLPEIEAPRDSFLRDIVLGLGYDPVAKDYKHVRLIFGRDDTLHSVAIYTLGAASWRIIEFEGKGFSDWPWSTRFRETKIVYLRGSLYFMAVVEETYASELVSIDLSSEVFCRASLPVVVHRHFYGVLTLVDGGSSLAIFDFDNCNMWVLESAGAESESMCWTKRYSFELSVPHFLYLKKDGDMLIEWFAQKTAFRLATGKELEQSWHLVSSYNLQSEEENILQQKFWSLSRIYDVCCYIESLTLLE